MQHYHMWQRMEKIANEVALVVCMNKEMVYQEIRYFYHCLP